MMRQAVDSGGVLEALPTEQPFARGRPAACRLCEPRATARKERGNCRSLWLRLLTSSRLGRDRPVRQREIMRETAAAGRRAAATGGEGPQLFAEFAALRWLLPECD